MPKYAATRLIRHGDSKGKVVDIPDGATVILSAEEAQPLLDCGALIAADEAAKKSDH